MYNNINQQYQQHQQQLQFQQQQQQQQQQQYYQSAVGANFQYNAGFGQPLMQQQQYQYQQQYQPARPGWAVSREEKAQYDQIFSAWDLDHSGYISGERAREIFGSSGLPAADLGHIWALADPNNHGKLNKDEFAVAMHLVYRKLNGGDIPPVLPDDLIPPSTRDISETLDFVKKSLMTDIPSRAGATNWGAYGSPSSQSSSTSLSKRLSVRSPDDVGYVSSARRGTASPASSGRHDRSQETSVGRLQKEISEQRLLLEAALSRASDPNNPGEDREVQDLKEQIRNAQSRLLASSNESIHQRLRSGAEDLGRLREERRNMDQEVSDLLRTVSHLASRVREADKDLEESRLELAKLKSGNASSGDAGIIGTGPGGSVTSEDRMKARIALMKAQRMAALTGKPIPSAAQAGIDPDQAARIRAERDVNEQNVNEIETAVRRLEDTMRQLERDLDNHARSQTGVTDYDRRKWEEGAGVESDIARRFIQELKPSTVANTSQPVSSYHSSSTNPVRHYTSASSQKFNVGSSVSSSPVPASSSITSSPTISNVSLVGKTPEERRAIIRAQAEKRLRDRQNDILSKSHSSRSEISSPTPAPAVPEVDAFTSAKFEEAERLAREKLLANAESKRRQAEQERQAERDLIASQEKQKEQLEAAKRNERIESERKAAQEAQEQREAAERRRLEEQEASQRKQAEELEQRQLAKEQEKREEQERKERFAQSTMIAKQQLQGSTPNLSQETTKKEPVRITLDSNPFAKHRKSISSSDDDWDTASPVNVTPPTSAPSATTAGSTSNNPFFKMMSSNATSQPVTHSKDTSDGWDVVEKDVDFADQLSHKLFSTSIGAPNATSFVSLESSTVPAAPSPLPATNIPPSPPLPTGTIPIPPLPALGVNSVAVPLSGTTGIPVPPPAPIGIPAAPPAPQAGNALPAPTASGARGALLSQIQTGIRLKKTTTNDKSTVKGVGRVVGEETSASKPATDGESITSHIASNSDQRPMGMPGLGGLFAGGMPTLKKSTGISTGRVDTPAEVHDSRRESTDWFGRLASHTPAESNSPAVILPSIQEPSRDVAATTSDFHSQPASHNSAQHASTSITSSNSEESIEDKVDFDRGYRAKSLWAFSAGAPGQLNLAAEEYLRAYPPKDPGMADWLYGVLENNLTTKGWFPKAYVQQIEEKFKARALYAYAGQNEGELSVERGDIVDILEKHDPQWWKAQASSNAIGMLPVTYLEEYIEGQPLPEELPIGKAQVLYTYAGESSEELSVEVGEMVDLMDKPDPLWWRVKNDQGRMGMLPSAYLKEIEGQSTSG